MDPLRGRIRVFVADDHPVYRDGLTQALRRRPDFAVVGESADGADALANLRRLRPDVAVLDYRMPGLDGAEILDSIRRERLETRVVLLSAFASGDVVYEAVAAGAAAFLAKDAERDEICDAVAAVARGETWLPQAVQGQLVSEVQARGVDTQPVLTAREREVLTLIADGMSAPSIAERLHLSPATVKSHLQHVYEKLGVSDRAAAVAEAMRRGLLR